MTGWLQRNPAVGVLAAACVLLLAVIGAEAGFGARLSDALRAGSPQRALPSEAKLLPPVIATSVEQAYPETTARPLFTPTRRPAPELAAVPQSTFQKGQFTLQGVIMVGDNRIAMLREKSNGRIYRVERGREVNGIKVIEVQPEAVTLALGGEQEVLPLVVQRPSGSPAAAAPAGPFAGPAPVPGAAPPAVPGGFASPPVAAGNAPGQGAPIPLTPGTASPGAIPAAGASPAAATNPAARLDSAPMSPEELLARRRARRTQQNQ
jgi:general secretion pathway protein N